ncbi:hypothetical protein L1887_47972 [Cichorium endivia]|nr:hypothetical protein L1887_47960 [Cichorium endivia]KAI3488038.1 hypothetical protein L1887_47966 [Cichorium endivia]KAI3488044.1 hypothetical protein L1887_47972 [Cichorium endivia]
MDRRVLAGRPGRRPVSSRTGPRRNGVRPVPLAPRGNKGSFLFNLAFEWAAGCRRCVWAGGDHAAGSGRARQRLSVDGARRAAPHRSARCRARALATGGPSTRGDIPGARRTGQGKKSAPQRLCSCVRRSTAAQRTAPYRALAHGTAPRSSAPYGDEQRGRGRRSASRHAGRPAVWPVCRAHGGLRGLRAHSAGVRRGCGLVARVRAQRSAAAGGAGSAARRAAPDSDRPDRLGSVPRRSRAAARLRLRASRRGARRRRAELAAESAARQRSDLESCGSAAANGRPPQRRAEARYILTPLGPACVRARRSKGNNCGSCCQNAYRRREARAEERDDREGRSGTDEYAFLRCMRCESEEKSVPQRGNVLSDGRREVWSERNTITASVAQGRTCTHFYGANALQNEESPPRKEKTYFPTSENPTNIRERRSKGNNCGSCCQNAYRRREVWSERNTITASVAQGRTCTHFYGANALQNVESPPRKEKTYFLTSENPTNIRERRSKGNNCGSCCQNAYRRREVWYERNTITARDVQGRMSSHSTVPSALRMRKVRPAKRKRIFRRVKTRRIYVRDAQKGITAVRVVKTPIGGERSGMRETRLPRETFRDG